MQSTSWRRRISLNVWLMVGLIGLVTVGFWLRWRFIHDVSPDVDEFTTLWAARRIVETGVPSFPSGVIYTRGILNMYITAFFIAVGDLTYVVGRLPSVLFGVAAIAAVLLVGRREWDSRVGWLAAVALVLIPETIKWDGRARFYAQLVFFALLTIWSAFQIARLGQEQQANRRTIWRAHLLFALFFVLSLFSQEETILLYPALALGLLWWRGWRYFFQPAAIVAHGLCVGAMALRYLFEQVAQPGYFAEMQVHKSYFNFSIDWLRNWYAIDRLFLPILPPAWAFLVPLALVVVGVQLYRVQGRPDRLARFHQATLFFFCNFWWWG
ncbi:MAG: glycosyltransferase family 39 protein [Caldilineaceae bacterium]